MEVVHRFVELTEIEDDYFIFNDGGWLLNETRITRKDNKQFVVTDNKRIVRRTYHDGLKEYEHMLNFDITYNENFTAVKLENSEDVKIGDLFRIGDYEY
jgi:hypothetical protein